MNDLVKKNLNIYNELRNNIDKFTEVFIEFYGEEFRSEIEEKFKKCILIGYVPYDEIHAILLKTQRETRERIQEDLIQKIPLQLDDKDLFDGFGLNTINITPIGQAQKFIEIIKVDKDKRKEYFREIGYQKMSGMIINLTREEFMTACENGKLPDGCEDLPSWIIANFDDYIKEDSYDNYMKSEFEKAKKILEKIYPGITLENVDQMISEDRSKFDKLLEIIQLVTEAETEYKNQIEELAQYEDIYNKMSEKTDKIKKLYFEKYVLENIDLVPEDIRDTTIDIIEHSSFYNLDERVKNIFSENITFDSNIFAFSKESDDKLNSEKTTTFTKGLIKKSRIEYFKAYGVDLGDEYEIYETSEEARRVWPQQERVEKLKESKFNLINEMYSKLYHNDETYLSVRQEIDSNELLDKVDGYNARIQRIPLSSINPNVVNTPNGMDLFSLALIFPDKDMEYTDHIIVHELNHLFELTLLESDNENYKVVSGWDVMEEKIQTERPEIVDVQSTDDNQRRYEAFNEVINETIAQDISALMHRKKIFVFDDPEKAKYKGHTSYEKTAFIINKFYQEFKPAILASRRNGNFNAIYDEVGKENFEELNSLFALYKKSITNEFVRAQAITEFQEGKNTELALALKEILEKRDKILDRMRMHSAVRKSQSEIQEQMSNAIQIS